jgi:hypothetical protein
MIESFLKAWSYRLPEIPPQLRPLFLGGALPMIAAWAISSISIDQGKTRGEKIAKKGIQVKDIKQLAHLSE